jgi:intraflagellar transport protein 81
MEKIQFIVDRLRQPPFNMRLGTMTDFDSKSSFDCLDIICEIIATIDPDQADLRKETIENRISRILHFLSIMKFGIAPDQVEHFKELLNNGNKDLLHSIMHWCLQRFEHLKKRAYLAKYLLPVEVNPEFVNEPLIQELMQRLKELQADFKEIHKASEAQRGSGARPGDLKAEIQQLEQEKVQLQNKINRIKKDIKGDDSYFTSMLKVTYTPHSA